MSNTEKVEKKASKSDNTSVIIVVLIIFIFGMIVFPAILLALFLAFLPTFVAFITDSSRNYSSTFCVGICNLAAFIPCFHDLYINKFSLAATSQLLHDVHSIFMILGGAGTGWLIHLTVPIITTSLYQANDKAALDKLTKKYITLKESWGDVIPDSEAVNSLREIVQEEEQVTEKKDL